MMIMMIMMALIITRTNLLVREASQDMISSVAHYLER